MAAQALSGIAKDLTKMSSKSAVKTVAGDGDGRPVPTRRNPHRLEERAQGRRASSSAPPCSTSIGYDDGAVGDGRCAGGHGARAVGCSCTRTSASRSEATAAVDPVEVGGDQPALRRAVLPVRLARHLVRGRPPGVPRRSTRLVAPGHRRVPRDLGHRLRHRPIVRPAHPRPWRRRRRRGPGRPTLGADPRRRHDRYRPGASASTSPPPSPWSAA